MADSVRYPTLFQINTRVWLERLSQEAGKRVTLADIDDSAASTLPSCLMGTAIYDRDGSEPVEHGL